MGASRGGQQPQRKTLATADLLVRDTSLSMTAQGAVAVARRKNGCQRWERIFAKKEKRCRNGWKPSD
jgi:hypothetical protein